VRGQGQAACACPPQGGLQHCLLSVERRPAAVAPGPQ
jgi:hypothetical protein